MMISPARFQSGEVDDFPEINQTMLCLVEAGTSFRDSSTCCFDFGFSFFFVNTFRMYGLNPYGHQ